MPSVRVQLYRTVLASIMQTPSRWEDVPGDTPETKAQWMMQHADELIRSGLFTPQQIYSIIQPIPDKHLGKTPDATYGFQLPEELKPLRDLYFNLRSLTAQQETAVAADILRAFGGDIGRVVETALANLKYRYQPKMSEVWPAGIVSKNMMEKLKQLASVDPESVHEFFRVKRQQVVEQRAQSYWDYYQELNEQYGVTLEEFSQLCHAGSPKTLWLIGGSVGAFVEKVGGIESATAMFKKIDSLDSTVSSSMRGTIGPIWSGLDESEEARKLYPYPQALTKDEVLRTLQLQKSNYPRIPSQAFDKPVQIPKRNEKNEKVRQERMRICRQDPKVLARFKEFIESGFEEGDGLLPILSEGATAADFSGVPNTFAARALYYFHTTLCGSSKLTFSEALDAIGYGHLKSKIMEGRVIPDASEPALNLSYRSEEEQKVVNKLRNTFGLSAIPYPVSVPAPSECPTNNTAFVLDFVMPCDVLTSWEQDEQGIYHPRVQQKVVFVGEYFGFDHQKEITVPEGQTWYDIDGQVAKIKRGGQDVELTPGATLTAGERYKLRTRWKQMTETFVAHATGTQVIHIHKDDDRAMMAELDQSHIVYQSKSCATGDMSCAVASNQLLAHLKECNKPDCDARKYFSAEGQYQPTRVSPIAAYIMSAISDVAVNYAFKPALAYIQGSYSRESMYDYYTKHQQLRSRVQKAYEEMAQAMREDAPNKEALRRIYISLYNRLQESPMQKLQEKIAEIKTKDKNYARREQGLRQLLDLVQAPGAQYDVREIKRRVDQLVLPYSMEMESAEDDEIDAMIEQAKARLTAPATTTTAFNSLRSQRRTALGRVN